MDRIAFLESISGIEYPEMIVEFFDQFIALKYLVEDYGQISVQEYENTHTSTSLHNPCKNCVISVRVYNSSTDYSTAVLTKMGDTYEVGRTTHAVPGNHKLKIARSDKTYLNTEHSALWYID